MTQRQELKRPGEGRGWVVNIAALLAAMVTLLALTAASSGPFDVEARGEDFRVSIDHVQAMYTDEDVRFFIYYAVSDDVDPGDLSVAVTLTSYGEEVARSPRVENATVSGAVVSFKNVTVAHHDVDKDSIGCEIRLYHMGKKIQTATRDRIPWEGG